ncbi:ATP-binding protein [Arthrobacter bambusae]|uniref:SpoVK/Ycf46/Vps4 family AAA+-type ATPase n=1 Tax=Arthrobacter bambusae TaxID=1338426 RepID=A0AAW8DEK8_9MICC|nr:ATP-binding protein [Arthrobacter bambusae]MDP9904710.1 SpoVK/Ycf46/Vps4 family AAA+-type ATPase [Arthrobacter bambusae]MDQ0129526.1 SpoVK/Ycf46/Vps4 family AAA+-type ATPase [Arthrobacter bambusae]MDQ0180861.1 SpoVK/Ycf46/Vps4 family AAA+-type ATPase [Arthrobacter bambusae]
MKAIEVLPLNVGLRIGAARLLLEARRYPEAIGQLNRILELEPANDEAPGLLMTATNGLLDESVVRGVQPATARQPEEHAAAFDWDKAEGELASTLPAPFADAVGEAPPDRPAGSRVKLEDVGGLERVKARLRESFLDPLSNPALAKAFGKSLRGGLMLYGPPGCGKTFLARAIAGELGASFHTASVVDVVGEFVGQTEKNVRAVFDRARRTAPSVLFLDELDAIGGRRSGMGAGNATYRNMVNQILLELDSVGADNEGLYVLGATNHPWDVDPALLRPGRFDRMLLVLPPDRAARAEILRKAFSVRPIAGIDVASIAARTEGYSGADLIHLVDSAAERALADSLARGDVIPIGMDHVAGVLPEIKPSTRAWMDSARNVVDFANGSGLYDELADFFKESKRR